MRKKNSRLTPQEIQYIKDMAPKYSLTSIAKYLGVTIQTICRKSNDFGIYKSGKLSEPITREKIKLLLKEGKTTYEIAVALNISKKSLGKYLEKQKISIKELNLEIMQDLIDLGLKKDQIVKELQITQVTFYNRLKKIKNNKLVA